jgi:hypothetical protein
MDEAVLALIIPIDFTSLLLISVIRQPLMA